MKKLESRTDWMDVGVTTAIFVIPSGILLAAIFASFTHIKDWALNHAPTGTHEWQGWAFACIVELIPIFGVLVMWKLRKANHDLTVPRFILGAGFLASMAGQLAYAGGLDAGVSRLIVAAGPSFAGLVLTEVLLWLVRTIVEKDMAPPPPAPVVVPPPPAMVIPAVSLAPVPPASLAAVPQDTAPGLQPVSPWDTPPGTALPDAVVSLDNAADVPHLSAPVQGDKPQFTATVPPLVSPSAGGEDMGGQDLPNVSANTDLSTAVQGGHVPQGTREEDTDPEGDTDIRDGGTPGLDPDDLETWAQHQDGKTKKELAAQYGKSEKTIQRRLNKVRAVINSTPKDEEHADA